MIKLTPDPLERRLDLGDLVDISLGSKGSVYSPNQSSESAGYGMKPPLCRIAAESRQGGPSRIGSAFIKLTT